MAGLIAVSVFARLQGTDIVEQHQQKKETHRKAQQTHEIVFEHPMLYRKSKGDNHNNHTHI